jgi:lysophospholipase L1-like esterase
MAPPMNRTTIAVVALSVALAALGAASVALFWMGRKLYVEVSAVRLDPLGLAVHARAEAPAPAANQRRVVLFGDSRALMWSAPAALPAYQFVNRGVGGQTTAQILGRFDHDVSPLHPDVVVIEMGVNDLKAIPVLPGRRDEIVATAKENIREVVARARALGASVVLVTVFPLGAVPLVRAPFWSDEVARSITELNAFVGELACDGVAVLHAGDVLADESGQVRAPFALDLLHLTPLGYAALNERKLLPLLEAKR